MATKKQETPASVDALVLVDCIFGSLGQVVELSQEDAKAGESHGMLDLNPAAIKAAKE